MAQQIGFAVFGLGRAGSNHLANIQRNPRAVLRYVVEAERPLALKALDKLHIHLDDSSILTTDQEGKAFEDSR